MTGWAGTVDVVKSTAEHVLSTTSKLIDHLEARLATNTPNVAYDGHNTDPQSSEKDKTTRTSDAKLLSRS